MTDYLDAIETETGPNPTASVIWLHGLGDSGHGWSAVVPALQLPRGVAVRFVFPHAPEIPVTINGGMRMPAWYDIKAADFNDRADLTGIRRSQAQIEQLIAREIERGVASERIFLAGFSQGGAIVLYAGLRSTHKLGGIIAMSTYLVDGESLATEASAVNRDTPIFMAHGTYDNVVRFEWGEGSKDFLQRSGWPVEWHIYPMDHNAVPEEIAAVSAFLLAELTR
ncbi:MAG: carboxylesterase [Gammaproteobacteria bacterium]|nr:carboxylesterase [Gammaproteobacteria bacterium]